MTRAGLRALAHIHSNPPVSKTLLRKSVMEAFAAHIPEYIIRSFIEKARIIK